MVPEPFLCIKIDLSQRKEVIESKKRSMPHNMKGSEIKKNLQIVLHYSEEEMGFQSIIIYIYIVATSKFLVWPCKQNHASNAGSSFLSMADFVFSKENDALNVTTLSFCWPGLLFYIEGLYSYICLRTVTATE